MASGASEGRYDDGVGELEDALAVIDWARAQFGCDALWLAGFSFGAAVALQAAARGARPRSLVTIAPPVGRIITDADRAAATARGSSCRATATNWSTSQTVRAWVAALLAGAGTARDRGAEHFFHGKLVELRGGMLRFLRAR